MFAFREKFFDQLFFRITFLILFITYKRIIFLYRLITSPISCNCCTVQMVCQPWNRFLNKFWGYTSQEVSRFEHFPSSIKCERVHSGYGSKSSNYQFFTHFRSIQGRLDTIFSEKSHSLVIVKISKRNFSTPESWRNDKFQISEFNRKRLLDFQWPI